MEITIRINGRMVSVEVNDDVAIWRVEVNVVQLRMGDFVNGGL